MLRLRGSRLALNADLIRVLNPIVSRSLGRLEENTCKKAYKKKIESWRKSWRFHRVHLILYPHLGLKAQRDDDTVDSDSVPLFVTQA